MKVMMMVNNGYRSSGNAELNQTLIRWLLLLAVLIVAIVVIGGITRLTESGLSITEWRPISGVIPPLGEAQWQNEFAHYRHIDQYGAIHSGMNLAQFKGIFFWEYTHRLLARTIGMIAALGWLWFAIRRRIPAHYGLRLLLVPLLVGVQGLLGWLMVASGLRPGMVEVAPGWLAAHLLTALITLAYIVWTVLDLMALRDERDGRAGATDAAARVTPLAVLAGALLIVQLVYGALMAGLRAGKVTEQWPLMNGSIFPGPTFPGRSLGSDLVNDPAIVHFIHRWWAWVVLVVLVVMGRRLQAMNARRESRAIYAIVGTQILLGIATVMDGVSLWLAALHQLVGALLVVVMVRGAHRLGRREG